ncbi:MAG: asparagine synthetase B family protein, partial [Thomasclavelia spiroformis]
VKPLYYYHKNDLFIFSSEIKCILMYLQRCIVDKTGVKELLGLGPSISPGRTLYKDIYSLRPGHYMNVYSNFKEIKRYWHLKRLKHTRNYEETVYDIRSLVNHSIKQQLLSDVPVSCMLSGGLDSSIITAVASQYVSKLSTYSIDYQDQDKYFQPYEYQTTRDEHYINEMLDRYSTNHKTVTVSQKQLVMALKDSLIARDAPGMADIDSSFLLFSKEISQHHKVVLSGECADEIFGGYPWFYRQDLINVKGFPWMREFDKRMELFNDNVKTLNIENYVLDKYYQTLDEIDYYDQNFEDEHKRKMIYLNIEWFMQTLLTRSDSQTMQSSIELRVPFANKDII